MILAISNVTVSAVGSDSKVAKWSKHWRLQIVHGQTKRMITKGESTRWINKMQKRAVSMLKTRIFHAKNRNSLTH